MVIGIRQVLAGTWIVMRDRRGIVTRAWDGTDVLVQWDDGPVGDERPLGADAAGAIETEYRFCPLGWDPIRREWKPGEDLLARRRRKLLDEFGL